MGWKDFRLRAGAGAISEPLPPRKRSPSKRVAAIIGPRRFEADAGQRTERRADCLGKQGDILYQALAGLLELTVINFIAHCLSPSWVAGGSGGWGVSSPP